MNSAHGFCPPTVPNESGHRHQESHRRIASRRNLGMLSAGVLAASSLLFGAAPAHASNTGVAVDDGVLRIESAAGRTNNLTVTGTVLSAGGGSTFEVRDSGNTLLLGDGCALLTSSTARCTDVSSVTIDTKDRNDSITLNGYFRATVHAGAGHDRVYGSGGRDIVYGGPGDDYLNGGYGHDAVYGELGNDILVGGDGNDGLSGGPGDDDLYAGSGDDLLLGGDGSDTLHGRDNVPFNDQLEGGLHSDVCEADTGDFTIGCGKTFADDPWVSDRT